MISHIYKYIYVVIFKVNTLTESTIFTLILNLKCIKK